MAAPEGGYFIQSKLKTSISRPAPHHASFKALWETKWQRLCQMGVYPFMFGSIHDFRPVVDDLIKKDMKEPYDWDAYAECFFPYAESLIHKAHQAKQGGNKAKASELYLRGSALYRISRFPAPRSEKQWYAWQKSKEAAIAGLSLREDPTVEVHIAHTHASPSDGATIPAYYHLPSTASPIKPSPLIIILTGLDGYRTELAVWIQGWHDVGCAVLILEIPGTGDNPGDRTDPKSAERVWSSTFDWIGQQEAIDQRNVVCWSFSTGGYYGIRMAHTHASKLKGVVALGGGVHHMFDSEWLDAVNHMEYPFDLATTLCHKFGYGTDFDRFKREASAKFSLLRDGTLDTPGCAKLLLVNGMDDEIFPIDDYLLCLQHGDPKEARFVPNTKHMGEPDSFGIILSWIFKLLGIDAQPSAFLATIPSKPKY